MKLIYCLWILIIVLVVQILSNRAEAVALRNYSVRVHAHEGEFNYTVKAPSDEVALDAVHISAIYNKAIGKIYRVEVLETNLSTEDLILRTFIVETERKTYELEIGVSDPIFALTAIQASRYLLSKAPTKNITYKRDGINLMSRNAIKYIVKFKSGQKPFWINTDDTELAKIALSVAASFSKQRKEFVEVIHPSSLPFRARNCRSLFHFNNY